MKGDLPTSPAACPPPGFFNSAGLKKVTPEEAVEILDAGGPRQRGVLPCTVEEFKEWWDACKPEDRRTIIDIIMRSNEAKKIAGVAFNSDNKFDIQLTGGLIAERRLAEVFAFKTLENGVKMELKTETKQWEDTGNMAVEFSSYGRPSGIAVTEADFWVHELRRDGETLVYLMFPIDRLKAICRQAIKAEKVSHNGGDNKAQSNVLLPLSWVLR